MKTIIFFIAFFIELISTSVAQLTIGFQNDIKNVGTLSSANTVVLSACGKITSETTNAQTITGITTFSNSSCKGNRYLCDTWTNGNVTDIKNNTYSTDYTFNFDKINQNVYAKYKDNARLSVILDKSQIKKFTIGPLNFIDASLVNPKAKGIFYQVLVDDSASISLYKFTTTKFVKADRNDLMKVRTGDFSNEYVDENTYFVSINKGELKKISLSETSIRKALKTKSEKADKYFNLNSSKDIDEGFLVGSVQYINQ